MTTSASTNQYREFAQKKFNSLRTLLENSETVIEQNLEERLTHPDAPPPPYSFWQLGNTFDTMIDFLDTIDPSTADKVAEIVVAEYQLLLARLKPCRKQEYKSGYDNAWFDDFGWWTIATQRAVGKPFFKVEYKNQFREFMSECWTRFTGNAPFVWDRRGTDEFKDCEPAATGGVWNEYWIGTPPNYPGPKGANPKKGNLEGIQNTVTNTVYLMAAQRLGDTDPNAKAAAERVFAFLFTWFSKKPDPLFHWLSGTEALMCERVSQFLDGSKAPGFHDDWFWTGDLGLMLGSLTDRISRAKQPSLLNDAISLLGGAKNRLMMTDEGLLRNWSNSGVVPDRDEGDYQVGAGVFWRNLLHAWKNNATLRGVIGQPDYQKFVQTNADEAANSTVATFDSLTQDVAVLTTATVVLP